MFLPSVSVNQRLWNHSVRFSLSFECRVSGLRGGAQKSDTESTVRTLDDGKSGMQKETKDLKNEIQNLGGS